MQSYIVRFKNGEPEDVKADRHAIEDEWLVLYDGDEETARYMQDDITGFRKTPPLPGPVYGNPDERRRRG